MLFRSVSVVALSSYSRGFHFAISCWQSIGVCYLIPGPLPCPEVVAVFYIRPAEVPTLFSVEGDAQVEQRNTVVGFLTNMDITGTEIDIQALAKFTLGNVLATFTTPLGSHGTSKQIREYQMTQFIHVMYAPKPTR